MNRTSIENALRKQCSCYHDVKDNEYWKCVSCDARDYIQLLVSRLEEIGCIHCDESVKELLQ